MVLSAQGNLGLHQTARTSLLEDNEHLRDLLTKALADKRKAELSLADVEAQGVRLSAEVSAGKDSIESLSEQISALKEQLDQVSAEAEVLTKERRTLAEMYAIEKRQRLAFEKELLEREIAERTHDQEGQ
jgi:archaellum component FlaC